MPSLVQFVDSIAASPTVRLDLNSFTSRLLLAKGLSLTPPPMRRVTSSSTLVDGEHIGAGTFGNRTIGVPLKLVNPDSADEAATVLQRLARELNRPFNFLKVQLDGMTSPVFFHTFRAPDYSMDMLRLLLTAGTGATLELTAKYAGYGLEEILPSVTVYNDPAEGVTLNANPYLETDASNWSNGQGVTVARTTSVAHEGVGSLQITPDGVTANPRAQSEVIPAAAGVTYWSSGWLRSNSGTPAVGVRIQWLDAALASLGFAGSNVTLTPSTTWIYADTVAVAPANTAFMRLVIPYTGTPTALNIVQADELRLRQVGSAGGACFDVTGIKGDVETPLYVKRPLTAVGSESLFAVRRRGTPANVPFIAPAENLTQGTDTTVQPFSSSFGGGGSNFSRITFATPAYADRLSTTAWPSTASVDARGLYRVFARVRQNGATSTIKVRLHVDGFDLDEKTIVGTTVQIVDLTGKDLMSIPAGADPVYDGPTGVEIPVRGPSIALRATRSGGSDTLDVDCLLFVPADDRLAIVHWPTNVSGADRVVAGDKTTWAVLDSTGELISGTTGFKVGGLPMVSPGVTNRIYYLNEVGVGLAEPAFPTSWTFELSYWPRYLAVRPATT